MEVIPVDRDGQDMEPAKEALRRMKNVTLSPHLGYVHDDNYRLFYRDSLDNVAAWLAGKPVRVINQ